MVIRLVFVVMLSVFCATALADPPKGYPFVSYDEGLRLAKAQNKKIFVYFGRYGCGYCAKTNKETFSDPQLRKRYIDHYVLVYVDAESGQRLTLPSGERISEMELGARLNVVATPVFLYLEPDGKVILRAPGYKTVKDFVDFDRYVQGGFYKHENINEFLTESSSS
jgi:thioredoxin-related protein